MEIRTESTVLVSLEQLRFVKSLVDRFATRPSVMSPLPDIQAHYIAIVAMLRSIWHVFEKVDCATAQKKKWCKAKWQEWKREAIFRDFIEPNRNQLLKEFEGGLTLQTPGMSSPVITGPNASFHVDFDVRSLRDSEGRPILDLFNQALSFWGTRLNEAQSALQALS